MTVIASSTFFLLKAKRSTILTILTTTVSVSIDCPANTTLGSALFLVVFTTDACLLRTMNTTKRMTTVRSRPLFYASRFRSYSIVVAVLTYSTRSDYCSQQYCITMTDATGWLARPSTYNAAGAAWVSHYVVRTVLVYSISPTTDRENEARRMMISRCQPLSSRQHEVELRPLVASQGVRTRTTVR